MNYVDHIKLVMGLDATAVDRGLGGVERKVDRAGKVVTSKLQSAQRGMRALALEFPVLGRLTELVFSPMSLAIVGIVGALKVWRFRQQELQRTLSETKIPDFFTTMGKERIDAGADAWKRYREGVDKTRESMHGLEAQFGRNMQQIQRLYDLMDELGGKSDARDKSEAAAIAAEKRAQASRLSTRAAQSRTQLRSIQRQVNSGLGGLSEASRQREIERQRTALSGAETDIAAIRGNLSFLNEFGEVGDMSTAGVYHHPGMRARFKAGYAGMTVEQAKAHELQRLSRAEQAQRAAQNRIQSIETAGQAQKERMAALATAAAADEATAKRLLGEASDVQFQAQIAHGVARLKAGRYLVPSIQGGGETTQREAVDAIRNALLGAGLMDQFAAGHSAVLDQIGLGRRFGGQMEPQERTASLVEEMLQLAREGGVRVNPVMAE